MAFHPDSLSLVSEKPCHLTFREVQTLGSDRNAELAETRFSGNSGRMVNTGAFCMSRSLMSSIFPICSSHSMDNRVVLPIGSVKWFATAVPSYRVPDILPLAARSAPRDTGCR